MINNYCYLIFAICIISTVPTFGQKYIRGQVKEKTNGEPVMGVSLIVWSLSQQKIIKVETTDNNGNYLLSVPEDQSLELRVQGMGFARLSKVIDFKQNIQTIHLDFFLEQIAFYIEEIEVQLPKLFQIQGDTIIYDASLLSSGNEQYAYQLLKNVPGVNVDEDGVIKYGNREIEKLMIDGTDFFEKGYQLLSLNMPAYPIDKIQILDKFDSNSVLKGVRESNKVAMNLTLKEDFRSTWFGNVLMGVGSLHKYGQDLSIDLMNVGKQEKYYMINQYNNVGNHSFDQVAHLIKIGREDEDFETTTVSDRTENIENIGQIKRSRINFNNEFLGSLNAITPIDSLWFMKVNSYFNWDRQRFFRETIERVVLPDIDYAWDEDLQQVLNRKEGFLRFGIFGERSTDWSLKSNSNLMWYGSKSLNNYSFNTRSFSENIREVQFRLEHMTNYSRRINDSKALLLNFNLVLDNYPQKHSINDILMHYRLHAGGVLRGTAKYIQRKSLNQVYELTLDQKIVWDRLGYNASYTQHASKTKLINMYSWQLTKYFNVSAWAKAILYAAITPTIKTEKSTIEKGVFIDPGVNLNLNFGGNQKITGRYSMNTGYPEIHHLIPIAVQTGYRTELKGLEQFDFSKSSTFVFNHQIGDWISGFSINSLAYFIWHHKYFASNSTIYPEFTSTEKIWVNNPYFFNLQSSIDYFIDRISSNLKLELSTNVSKPKNKVEGYLLPNQVFKTYGLKASLRTGFTGFINVHIGGSYSETSSSLPKEKTASPLLDGFVDLYFKMGERLDGYLLDEWYYLNDYSNDRKFLHLLDIRLKYKPKLKSLQMELVGSNLMNTKYFNYQFQQDFGYSTISQRLLPRRILLKAFIRF